MDVLKPEIIGNDISSIEILFLTIILLLAIGFVIRKFTKCKIGTCDSCSCVKKEYSKNNNSDISTD
jgi:hypothetical protein